MRYWCKKKTSLYLRRILSFYIDSNCQSSRKRMNPAAASRRNRVKANPGKRRRYRERRSFRRTNQSTRRFWQLIASEDQSSRNCRRLRRISRDVCTKTTNIVDVMRCRLTKTSHPGATNIAFSLFLTRFLIHKCRLIDPQSEYKSFIFRYEDLEGIPQELDKRFHGERSVEQEAQQHPITRSKYESDMERARNILQHNLRKERANSEKLEKLPKATQTNLPPPLSAICQSPVPKPISVRQDSNVSSDSFSQTSSPSYTSKTMEAPLLPHKHGKVPGMICKIY